MNRERPTGEKARAWKGDKAGYTAIHVWLVKHYTKEVCAKCRKTKDEVSRLEWSNISGEYKRDVSDYEVLCPSCHRKKDLKRTHCKNGHPRLNNTKINYKGWIICQTCNNISQKKYREKKRGKNN